MSIADVPWLPLALALIYLAAAACIYRILMTYRVAQGAIAWILALIGLPYVAVPMFLLFGRNRFGGYIRARRTGDAALTVLGMVAIGIAQGLMGNESVSDAKRESRNRSQ